MDHTHHSLRYALTRTILVWAGIFFTLIGIIFLLTFDDLRSYTLHKVAEYRLNYQTEEFAKHLKEMDKTSIKEESDALVQDPEIAGIVLIDSSGELLQTSIHDDRLALLSSTQLSASSLSAIVYKTPHLHLFESNIPDSSVKLFLVLDDRPITRAIQTSTLVTGILLLLMLILSIFALHRVLRIQLIEPMDQLHAIIRSGENMPDSMIQQMEDTLPSEAGDILETYDHLVHAEHEMARRFHEMLDRVPGCVWSASSAFDYIEVSVRAMQVFNTPAMQVKGFSLWSWLPDEKQRNINMKQLNKAIQKHAPTLDMAYRTLIEGREHWFGENISLHYVQTEAGGKLILGSLFGISNDITRRKEEEFAIAGMQQQARKMEAVGTLVGGIAHEFNNMLAGIIGNVFLLKTEIEAGSKTAVRLGRIENLGNRAASLVDQLLAFGRKNRISVRSVAIVQLLQQVHAIESAGLPSHIRLNINATETDSIENLAIRADPALVKQVLTSLIRNAADACANKESAEISIAFKNTDSDSTLASRFPQLRNKEVLCIRVSDTGTGIRSDLLDRVFDPFFTTKEVGKGTGMGLSMVYGLMESFGGAVELNSIEGSGTSVLLYFQLAEALPAYAVKAVSSSTLCYGQGQTVLVADDEVLLREGASEMLDKLGYKAVVVADGESALQYMQEHGDTVSIILLDLIMPGMGGAQAAGRIRQIRTDVPIVFVTGFNLSEAGSKELQIPDSRIVTKPYEIAHLSQVMAEMLQQPAKS